MENPTPSTTAPPPGTGAPTGTPAPTPAPDATLAALRGSVVGLRERASELHAAADRAEAAGYVQRGQTADQATRAAGAARYEADTALEQAQRERAAAQEFAQDARVFAEQAGDPNADAKFARQMASRREAQARAAEQRAQALERDAAEADGRADALEARVAELQQAETDYSGPLALREAGWNMERAAAQLEEKVELLDSVEAIEREAAGHEVQGDTVSAEALRAHAAELRSRADAIEVEIPQVDPRLLEGAEPTPAGPQEPGGPAVPGSSAGPGTAVPPPATPDAAGRPAGRSADTDADGLSDAVEQQLGTNARNADTDGDGRIDGLEVAFREMNPRARGPVDATPGSRETMDTARATFERERGLSPNADSDGDGFADWVEVTGDLQGNPALVPEDIVHNLSPLDEFLRAAQSQEGKPYRFGAKSDPTDSDGGTATWDSSELVEWAAQQAGVRDMPDGSWNQYRHLHEAGASVPVEEALRVKGALVFGFSSDPLASPDRPARAYVGISLGNGKVLDVSERSGVVREMDPGSLYTHAAVIPALHQPTGDLDGDGWTDAEELRQGGDVSRGITTPRATDPVADPVAGMLDDPTGSTLYDGPAGARVPGTDPSDPPQGDDDDVPTPYDQGAPGPYIDPAVSSAADPDPAVPGDPAVTPPAPAAGATGSTDAVDAGGDAYGDSYSDGYGDSYGDSYEADTYSDSTY